MMDTMPHWLEKRAQLTPERTAIQLEDGTDHTFQKMRDDAISFAYQLNTAGVQRGDHIAILSQNSYEMAVAIHALSYIGAVGVLLNTRLSPRELAYQIKDSESAFLLYDERLNDKTVALKREDIHARTISFTDVRSLKETSFQAAREINLNKTFTIMYTSGTTGFPKGVQHTYGNHWWSAVSSALNLGLHEHDRWLAALPLFHVGGFSILIRSLAYGMPVHLHERFDAKKINDEIMENGVSIVSVVSVMLEEMIRTMGDDQYPETFRCMLLGGGPAPLPLLKACKDKNIPVIQTYGMTETSSQISTLSHEDAIRKLGSAGKPLFPAQLNIVKDNQLARPGEIGEIYVKGPMVTSGYYKRKDANARSFKNGWLKTGDLGYIDEEGYLYVVDRRKDLIISGGENVYPAEIESVLKEINGIYDAGVAGKKDEKWGEIPVAFIVKDESSEVTKESVIDYCKTKLAKYKVPKDVFFVHELPRNASKKLLRRKLSERLNGDM
ncbi:MAG: o-succinylbenzoate--CoA ligase [Bacillaceae bacterium]|nr:o-succinylbenzoate--CoA ligase [Bacillaceae bacterium]